MWVLLNSEEGVVEGRILVPHMDPAKLALGDRGAGPRVQKITAWLAIGKQQGRDPGPQIFMPLSANQSKGDSIGQRQRDLAKELHAAGLLSAEGLVKILP